jgi:peroxiredoxin
VLAAVIFNALIIIALIPLALRGVKYRPAERGRAAAPQPADLRRGRRDRAVPGHLADRPAAGPAAGKPNSAFVTLAQLVRYEHVQVSSDNPQFAAAMSKLEADDQARQSANFTLTDLTGKSWTLRDLRGKVVLVNFWATWCPPCRKEMPDLEALGKRFGPQGLVILAISDEDATKVKPFIAEHQISYPILLDPGRKVNDTFRVEGIPKSFVYDREGKLVAQAIDMRTERQFLAMLAQARID